MGFDRAHTSTDDHHSCKEKANVLHITDNKIYVTAQLFVSSDLVVNDVRNQYLGTSGKLIAALLPSANFTRFRC